MRLTLLALLLACSVISSRAEDWTTRDGKTFRNVTVLSHDDAYVTIMHDDGGGRVALSQLDPTLQKRFDYDPAKAAACIQATAAADQRDHAALLQEQHQQDVAMAAQPSPAPFAPGAPAPSPPPLAPPAARSTASAAPGVPAVDVVANEARIGEDQTKLNDLAVDIRLAQRDRGDYGSYYSWWDHGAHYDATGTLHPNTVGTDAGDRLPELQQQQTELQAEIKKLQDEDAKAQTASSP
jgi:hypothetical protein